MTTPEFEKMLENIARREFGVATLEARKSDRLDFYTVSVWQIREALIQAYAYGRSDSIKKD